MCVIAKNEGSTVPDSNSELKEVPYYLPLAIGFRKLQAKPLTDELIDLYDKRKTCSFCDPGRAEENGSSVCPSCTEVLLRLSQYEQKKLYMYAVAYSFPEWYIEFFKRRTRDSMTVKEAREYSALTQKQLAELLDVSDKTIKRWERQQKLADKDVLTACGAV